MRPFKMDSYISNNSRELFDYLKAIPILTISSEHRLQNQIDKLQNKKK